MEHDREHWLERFKGHGQVFYACCRFHNGQSNIPTSGSVPFGPINNLQQTFDHPQAIARGVAVEVKVSAPQFRHLPVHLTFHGVQKARTRRDNQIGRAGCII